MIEVRIQPGAMLGRGSVPGWAADVLIDGAKVGTVENSAHPERDGIRLALDRLPRDIDMPWQTFMGETPSLSGKSARTKACFVLGETDAGFRRRLDFVDVVERYAPLGSDLPGRAKPRPATWAAA